MREQLLALLLEHPKIDSVSPESNLLTDFGLSPQEVADLVCTIEDELDIAIPDKDLIRLNTVGDICDYVDLM